MKQAAEPQAVQTAQAAGPARTVRPPQRKQFAMSSSPLTQLAAMMNGSPRVQGLIGLSEEINQTASAQLHSVPVNRDAGLEREGDATGYKTQPSTGGSERGSVVQREQDAPPPNRTGLPDQLKSGVESLSGVSLDNVKVHY